MRLRASLAAVLTAAVSLPLVVAGAGPAAAHARPTTSSPGDGEVLSEPPTSVSIEFRGVVDARLRNLTLRAQNGTFIPIGAIDIVSDEESIVSADILTVLPDGVYIAAFAARAADDGTIADGELIFAVDSAGAGIEIEPIGDVGASSGSSSAILIIVVSVVGLVALVGLGLLARARIREVES